MIWEIDSATQKWRSEITTLYCFDFFSHMERTFLFAWGLFIYFWMKSVSYTVQVLQDAGFTLIVWLIQLSEYVDIMQGKSFKGKFFLLCCSYQAKISQVIRSFFICEKFPLLLYMYLLVFMYLYLSIYFKIVWPQVPSSQATCRSRRCYRNKERELSQVKREMAVFILEMRLERSSSRRVMRLVPVLILETVNWTNYKMFAEARPDG